MINASSVGYSVASYQNIGRNGYYTGTQAITNPTLGGSSNPVRRYSKHGTTLVAFVARIGCVPAMVPLTAGWQLY